MLRKSKTAVSGVRTVLLESYSKYTGIQLVLTLTRYTDNTSDLRCTLEMCSGMVVNGKTVCNWCEDKLVMVLSASELAAFSKYSNPYYLERLGTPKPVYEHETGKLFTRDGKPVFETDVNGNVVVYSEKLYHKYNDTVSILTIHKSNYSPLGCGITLKNGDKELTIYLDENTTYQFTKTCELAMNQMMLANVVEYNNPPKEQPNNYTQKVEQKFLNK